MSILWFTVALMVAIAMGIPIAFALLASGLALMLMLGLFDAQIMAQNLINGADSYELLAVPFFILAGELMNAGGISRRIIDLPIKLVGHLRGGLGYVAIIAAVLMASLSGSAAADTAALATILIPMMREAGYRDRQSVGLIATGGIIAPVIPPSIAFIIIGVAGGISISQLFMAGIFPGLMMGVTLAVIWWWQSRSLDLHEGGRATRAEVLESVRAGLLALFMPVIVIGGFRFGIFTPTEAGVVAAVYALVLGTVVYREMNIRQLYDVLFQAAETTAIVMLLVAAAAVSAWLITIADFPAQVVTLLQPLIDSPRILMATIMLIVFLIGMPMDLTPTVLILVPVLMPLIDAAGIDPVYFGVMFILNCSIGLITPPVGNVLNVIAGVSRLSFEECSIGVLPYLTGMLVLMIIFLIFPGLITVPAAWLIG